MKITLGACVKPICDCAWLVDTEARNPDDFYLAFYFYRTGRQVPGHGFICADCMPQVVQYHASQQARALLRSIRSGPGDGALGVGLDQPVPPTLIEDGNYPTWIDGREL